MSTQPCTTLCMPFWTSPSRCTNQKKKGTPLGSRTTQTGSSCIGGVTRCPGGVSRFGIRCGFCEEPELESMQMPHTATLRAPPIELVLLMHQLQSAASYMSSPASSLLYCKHMARAVQRVCFCFVKRRAQASVPLCPCLRKLQLSPRVLIYSQTHL